MASKTYEVRLTASNSDLIRKMVEAGDATERASRKMSGSVDQHSTKVKGALGRIETAISSHAPKLGGLIGDIGGAFGAIPGPVGIAASAIAVVGGVLASTIGPAERYEQAHEQLVVALKNSHTTWKAQADAIDNVEASSRKLGFTDGQTEAALAVMTRGMGSSRKALADLGLAQDLSRAKNIDLAQAALLVTRASEGQIRPIKMLGIDLPFAAGGALKLKQAHDKLTAANENLVTTISKIHQGFIKGPAAIFAYQKAQDAVKAAQEKVNTVSMTGNDIIAALSRLLKGSATAAASGYGGAQRDLHAQLDHVQRIVGEKLLPILIKVETWIADKGIPWLTKLGTTVGPVFQLWLQAMGPVLQMLNDIYQIQLKVWNLEGNIVSKVPGFGGGTDFATSLAFMNAAHVSSPTGGSQGRNTGPIRHRAAGGPIMPGVPYRVGEHGEETFVSSVPGTIIPHAAGMNVTVYVTGPVFNPNSQFNRNLALAIQNQLTLLGKR